MFSRDDDRADPSLVPTNNAPIFAVAKQTAPSEHRSGARGPTVRPSVPPSAPQASQNLDILGLLKALRRRWVRALGLGLLGGILALAIAWIALPAEKYTATTIFHVKRTVPKVVWGTSEPQSDFDSYISNQVVQVKSRNVLNVALRNTLVSGQPIVAAQADPIEWLEDKIQVTAIGEFLRISMTGEQREQVTEIVNGVADAYKREVIEVEQADRRTRFEKLKHYSNTYYAQLEDKRQVLEGLSDQIGAKNPDVVSTLQSQLIENRNYAKRLLMEIEHDLKRLENELAVKKRRMGVTGVEAGKRLLTKEMVEAALRQDPLIYQYEEDLAQLEKQTQGLRHVVRNPNNEITVTRVQQDMKAVRDRLEKQKAEILPRVMHELEEALKLPLNPAIAELEEQIEYQRKMQASYKAELEGMSDESGNVNRRSTELERITEEIKNTQEAYDLIGKEIVKLNVELDAPPRVVLQERAVAPRKLKDSRPTMAGIAGVGAFGMIALAVSLLEYRARRIGSTEAVTWGLGMPLMGALPALPRARGLRPSVAQERLNRARGLMLESVNAMRTVLLRLAADQGVRAVMVTSAVEGEGKTSLACHLASSLARAGRRTVLLDCDLRKPTVHRLFDLSREPGLGELLRGEATLDEVVQAGPVEGRLGIIAAGVGDSRAIEGLALGAAAELIEQLKSRYDFVVVDTAPILPVADALLIGQHLDGAIFSILHDVSQVPKVYSAHERLRLVGIRNLGAVMTGVRGEAYANNYYYSSTYTQPVAEAPIPGERS